MQDFPALAMENDGGMFTVRVFPWQLGLRTRIRRRPPSQRTVDRLVTELMRPARANADAERQVLLATQLLYYWPSAFGPIAAELQRRRAARARAALLARRRATRAARLRQQREQQQQPQQLEGPPAA